ncbi:DsrE family protein [Crenalkalicoccus roseus]|uniref:DsrE family protein n=1 Tax=Crenalkalicoccus roseus TaxID=1485588 RepID=UPI0010815CE4|nr:DsrE family protein [Crenalkalicoccus roseus]
MTRQGRTRRAILAALAAVPLVASGVRETPLAEPRPTIEAPRRIVVSLSEGDPERANAVFSNLVNIQGFYGQDLVEIMVVAYGPGVRHLLRERSQVAERVASLQAYDIAFVACGATLDTLGLGPEAVLDGVQVVQNGLPEVVERQLMGWIHLRP